LLVNNREPMVLHPLIAVDSPRATTIANDFKRMKISDAQPDIGSTSRPPFLTIILAGISFACQARAAYMHGLPRRYAPNCGISATPLAGL
jgi:hypothetical protein